MSIQPCNVKLQQVWNLQYPIYVFLFFPCDVLKATVHVGTKMLNMSHQEQKEFHGIFVGISQHQKWYIFYAPHKRNIVYLYNVVFGYIISSVVVYTSQPYIEAMAMWPDVSYISDATSSRGVTGNIITFIYLKRGVYYLKLLTIRNVITILMMIQIFHH